MTTDWSFVRAWPSEIRAKGVKVEQEQKSWVAKAGTLPLKVSSVAIAKLKKGYQQLKNRYGPGYTYAMASAAFFTFFLPIPGISLLSVAFIVGIAEIHRAISKRGGFSEAIGAFRRGTTVTTKAKELAMAIITCDVILQWSATPEQLTNLGAALWRNLTTGTDVIYQYLDNQALSDLITGRLPALSQMARRDGRRGVHFRFRDETSHDRQKAIDRLRGQIPAKGVEDILVDGTSWNVIDRGGRSPASGGDLTLTKVSR